MSEQLSPGAEDIQALPEPSDSIDLEAAIAKVPHNHWVMIETDEKLPSALIPGAWSEEGGRRFSYLVPRSHLSTYRGHSQQLYIQVSFDSLSDDKIAEIVDMSRELPGLAYQPNRGGGLSISWVPDETARLSSLPSHGASKSIRR